MKTKEYIKNKSRELFNQQGISSVTLRDVASAINKSYGNITYHFPTKENLLQALYFDMVSEMQAISIDFTADQNLFDKILAAPEYTFHISLKYLFLFKDYVHIMRAYPNIAESVQLSNESRKQALKQVLQALLSQGILRKTLKEKDILYIMELSAAMRTFFFLQIPDDKIEEPELQSVYIAYINQLLYPYLSEKGQELWEKIVL